MRFAQAHKTTSYLTVGAAMPQRAKRAVNNDSGCPGSQGAFEV